MISIKDLTFHYRKGITILEKINTELRPGHIYGLLGLNGTGKTTFLKLIAGLQFPVDGSLYVNGEVPKNRNMTHLSELYFIADEINLPKWRIKKFAEIYGSLYPKFDTQYFYDLLRQLKVDDSQKIENLSYGQQKKVNIAFGLATNVSVLLMDEPTNGLDIPSKSQFRTLLSKYTTDDKIIILSTHQTRDLDQLIDHLLVIHHNKLILDESIYELSRNIRFANGIMPNENALYSERTMGGTYSIFKNDDGQDAKFDTELFFNVLTQDENFLTKYKSLTSTHHE